MRLLGLFPHAWRPRVALLAAPVLAFGLFACATRQLVPDFAAFSEAYARDMNWQMLLNLARLDQGHPAYFMAIGEIRLGRTQNASLQSTGTSSHTTGQTVAAAVTRTATDVLSGSLTPNISANASPTFVFIPINSEEATRQLLEPISIEAFNTLYQQGWPVDQLLRVLVERIEVDLAPRQPGGQPERIVLTNSPTRGDPETFQRFLRTCEVIRAMQKAGGLSLIAEARELTPEEQKALAATRPRRSPPGGAGGRAGTGRDEEKEEENLPKFEWIYHFNAEQEVLDRTFAGYRGTVPFRPDELDNLREVFTKSNLQVASRLPAGRKPAGTRAVLILRSFRNLLDAVAKEQRAFAALAGQGGFLNEIPRRQQRPVLRTDWSVEKREAIVPPVIRVAYGGANYAITDPSTLPPTDVDARWNRDVFRLLVDLSFQVTVDITKFQRQVLELTQ